MLELSLRCCKIGLASGERLVLPTELPANNKKKEDVARLTEAHPRGILALKLAHMPSHDLEILPACGRHAAPQALHPETN